jgi:NAD(P)-dependent dehydrogenase (short-subunit alcohol dehydrogenase family)
MPKAAVIIGAAAGVGRATAWEFARNSCDVALLPYEPSRLEEAAAECRDRGAIVLCPIGPRLPIRATAILLLPSKIRNLRLPGCAVIRILSRQDRHNADGAQHSSDQYAAV